MKTKYYGPDKIFGKSILIERSPIKENEGLPLAELKYIKKEIAEYVDRLKTDKKKFDYLSKVYAELEYDFEWNEVKNKLDKYYGSDIVKFEMYFEATITKKYAKTQLKHLGRKLGKQPFPKNIVKPIAPISIRKVNKSDHHITDEKIIAITENKIQILESKDERVTNVSKYKSYLALHNYPTVFDLLNCINLTELSKEICEVIFPNLDKSRIKGQAEAIRTELRNMRKLPQQTRF